jgi:hypothetical protein
MSSKFKIAFYFKKLGQALIKSKQYEKYVIRTNNLITA